MPTVPRLSTTPPATASVVTVAPLPSTTAASLFVRSVPTVAVRVSSSAHTPTSPAATFTVPELHPDRYTAGVAWSSRLPVLRTVTSAAVSTSSHTNAGPSPSPSPIVTGTAVASAYPRPRYWT